MNINYLFIKKTFICLAALTVETGSIEGKKVCTLNGTYTTDVTLPRGNYYALDGKIQIGNDMGSDGTKADGASATLTIEAGVTIFGDSGSDYLVVMRGSKINAIGTKSAPIIMTARADVMGQVTSSSRGLWGGLVILGKAQLGYICSSRTTTRKNRSTYCNCCGSCCRSFYL